MTNNKPSIIDRLKLARRVFGDGLPWAKWGDAPKELPVALWPAWKQDTPQYNLNGVQSYIDEGFGMNALIYAAIMYKAKAMAQAPLRAYSGESDRPELLPDNHPLQALCQRPNPSQSWAEFIQTQSIWLNTAGEAFTYIDRKGGALGVPNALYPLNPLKMGIVPLDKNTVGYVYDKTAIDSKNISHVKYPNPGDPLEGMGHGRPPLMSAARSGDVDNAITDFLYRFFKSGTMMNVYVTYSTPMDPDVMKATREKFREIYGGYENWGVNVGVFDSGGKVERLGMNFNEMGFSDQDERNEARILMAFGVPGILVGSRSGLMRSTYSNYEQAQKAFWQDTMLNEIKMFEDDLRYYVQSTDGGFVALDTSDIKVLQQDKPALATAYVQLVSSGSMTQAQAAQWLGIDLPAIEQLPEATPGDDDIADATEDERGDKSTKSLRFPYTPEQKTAHWKAHDATARKWESEFMTAARQVFDKQRKAALAIINDAKSAARKAKASVDWRRVGLDIDAWFENAGDDWRETFMPLVEGVVTDSGKRWAVELGINFSLQNMRAMDWFSKYALKFAQEVNQTTIDALHEILARALADGTSVPDMQKQIDATFEAWMGTHDETDPDWQWFLSRRPAYRTEMIARTETIRASNSGNEELFREWGVEQKEWLSTKDDRTRGLDPNDKFDHWDADGQVVGINERFDVSGEMLDYPGDPTASPGNTINCRCAVLPVL